MKIFTALIKTILAIIMIAVISLVAAFFVTIFFPSGTREAIEIFKSIFKLP